MQVLLARSAPIGIVFRRGPTRWVQAIKWNTKNDDFESGQWLHGRVYVGRSDLSPDGSLLIYFAGKFKKSERPEEDSYAWTAISKPPYLTALARWPKGDCWHGGGLFTSAGEVFLNHRPEDAKPDPLHLPRGIRVRPNPEARGEDDPITIPRMERDGWSFVQWLDYDFMGRRTKRPAIFEKLSRRKKVTLRVEKYHDNLSERWVCYLVNNKGKQIDIGIGTWVDFDQQGRIVFASEGKLFSVSLRGDEIKLVELADFSDAKPQPLEAPMWATDW
ncbi:MAG: hypothetical protein WAU58_08960 [Terriglobales bacterium]